MCTNLLRILRFFVFLIFILISLPIFAQQTGTFPLNLSGVDLNGAPLEGVAGIKGLLCITGTNTVVYVTNGTVANCLEEPGVSSPIIFESGFATFTVGGPSSAPIPNGVAFGDNALDFFFYICTDGDFDCGERLGPLRVGKDTNVVNANFLNGVSSNEVILKNDPVDELQNVSNGGKDLTLGETVDATGTFKLIANTTVSVNKPSIQYNATLGTWQISNDGTTFSDILTGVGAGDITAIGDCISGDCFVDGVNNTLIFEGSVIDANETVLQGGNPAADVTLTLPTATGSLVSTGGVDVVTSTMIADGTITSTDILDGTITGTDILDGSITGADITDGTIASADIADVFLSNTGDTGIGPYILTNSSASSDELTVSITSDSGGTAAVNGINVSVDNTADGNAEAHNGLKVSATNDDASDVATMSAMSVELSSATTSGLTDLIKFENNSAASAVTNGIKFNVAAGGMGYAIDANDPDIGTVFKTGSNDVFETLLGTVTASNINLLIGGITFTDLTNSGTLTATTVDINGGAIDGTTIGATTPAAGTFTDLTVNGPSINIGNSPADLLTENATRQGTTVFTFEGATADAFETSINIEDPTVLDKTLTIPNKTGTFAVIESTGLNLGSNNLTQAAGGHVMLGFSVTSVSGATDTLDVSSLSSIVKITSDTNTDVTLDDTGISQGWLLWIFNDETAGGDVITILNIEGQVENIGGMDVALDPGDGVCYVYMQTDSVTAWRQTCFSDVEP